MKVVLWSILFGLDLSGSVLGISRKDKDLQLDFYTAVTSSDRTVVGKFLSEYVSPRSVVTDDNRKRMLFGVRIMTHGESGITKWALGGGARLGMYESRVQLVDSSFVNRLKTVRFAPCLSASSGIYYNDNGLRLSGDLDLTYPVRGELSLCFSVGL